MSEPTVTLNPTPDAPVVASDDVFVTDSKGRTLKIKAPDILFESRLVRIMGNDSANSSYMYGYVIPAVNVVEIDGDKVTFPASLLQVEALIGRLGHEGLAAVHQHLNKKLDDAIEAQQQLKN